MRSRRLVRLAINTLAGAVLSALYVVPVFAQDKVGDDVQWRTVFDLVVYDFLIAVET